MKKTIIVASSAVLLLAIALSMYLLNGCQKNVEPIETINMNFSPKYIVKGLILDQNQNPVANATVEIDQSTLKTDQNGKFIYETNENGTKLIKIVKDGFIDYYDQIKILEIPFNNSAIYNLNINLTSPSASQTINTSSGRYIFNNIAINLQENSLSTTKQISITALNRNGIYPEDRFAVNTIHFEPSGLAFNNEVTVSVLNNFYPFILDIEIFSMDYSTGEWIYLEDATYNYATNSYEFKVNHFSSYALLSKPSISTKNEDGALIAESVKNTCDSEIGMKVTFESKKIEGCKINKSVSSEVSSSIGSQIGNDKIAKITSEINATISSTTGVEISTITEKSEGVEMNIPARIEATLRTYPRYQITTFNYTLIYSPSVDAPNYTIHLSFITTKALGTTQKLSTKKCCPNGQFWCDQCNNCIAGDKAEHDCVVHRGGTWVNGKCHQGGSGN